MKLEDEQAVTADIRKEFFRADAALQARIKVSAAELLSSATLTAHRGWQTGVYDAYKVIKKSHPKAAEAILFRFKMSRSGTITA